MDSQGVPLWYKVSLFFAMIIAFVFLVMAYYLPEYELWYDIFTFSLLGLSLVIVSGISLINFLMSTETIETYDHMVMDKLGNFFEKLNVEYAKRQMEWVLIPGHYWLELRINQRRNNLVEQRDENYYTTNLETENRLSTIHKNEDKREEMKMEEPMHRDLSLEENNNQDSIN